MEDFNTMLIWFQKKYKVEELKRSEKIANISKIEVSNSGFGPNLINEKSVNFVKFQETSVLVLISKSLLF